MRPLPSCPHFRFVVQAPSHSRPVCTSMPLLLIFLASAPLPHPGTVDIALLLSSIFFLLRSVLCRFFGRSKEFNAVFVGIKLSFFLAHQISSNN